MKYDSDNLKQKRVVVNPRMMAKEKSEMTPVNLKQKSSDTGEIQDRQKLRAVITTMSTAITYYFSLSVEHLS